MKRNKNRLLPMLLVALALFGQLTVAVQASAADGYLYQYPKADNYPYYQMSMYAYKRNALDAESYPTGVFRLLNTADQTVSYAYCADGDIYDEFGFLYRPVPLTALDSTQAGAGNLRAIINHTYPFVTEEEMVADMRESGVYLNGPDSVPYYEMVLITATQQAIYTYTNPEMSIEQRFAGSVRAADYAQYYQSYIFDFCDTYRNALTDPAFDAIEHDVLAVFDYLTSLAPEAAPEPRFAVQITFSEEDYLLTISDGDLQYAEPPSILITQEGAEPITLSWDQLQETSGVHQAAVSGLTAGEATVTVSGTYLYTDAVAYASEEQSGLYSQPFIGQGPRSAEFEVPATVTVPEKPAPPVDPPSPPGPSYTQVTATKEWVLDDGGTPPQAVTVALLRNGETYKTAELHDGNHWTHTWQGLNDQYNWTVAELDVPEGFTASIKRSGSTFTIVNDDIATVEEPEGPADPGTPEEPDDPGLTNIPDPSDPPAEADPPADTGTPDTPVAPALPQTGQLWWPVWLLMAGSAVLLLAGFLGKKGKYGKHDT